MVITRFDREGFTFKTFAKIFWIRLALPHFSCIHFFYWGVSLLGEILDLLSKMTWNAQSKHITLVLSCFRRHFLTVNPRFLQDDLFSSKKCVYMKNAEQRAGFEIFCRKSWKFKYSLSKSTTTTPKLCNLFTVWFPKELVGHNFHALRSQNRAVFTSLPFQGYCELEGPVQTTAAHGHTCLLSHKGCLSATQSRRTSSVNGCKQLHENVINH